MAYTIRTRENSLSASSITNNLFGPDSGHWRQLAVLLRRAPDMAEEFLRRPSPAFIPPKAIVDEIMASASQKGLTELADKHLLSGLLLTPKAKRDLWPVDGRDLAGRCLNGIDQDTVLACSWIQVPLLVIHGATGRIIRMLVGWLPDSLSCRCVGAPLPEKQTAGLIHAAFRLAAGSHGFIYWFLQQASEPPVQGASLGLPTALAVRLLLESRPWPEALYATGSVEADGNILPVAHIKEKYHVAGADCRFFLMPRGDDILESASRKKHICTTFKDACFAVDLYGRGIPPDKAALCQACRYSIRELLFHFHTLPLSLLEAGPYRQFLRQASEDPEHYLESLHSCLRQCSHDRQRGRLLAELFLPEHIIRITGRSPHLDFAAFNWSLACIGYYNHSGRVDESMRWRSLADRMRSMVEPEEIGKLMNHGFVAERFNRYDFRPELPSEFAAFLAMEEERQAGFPGSNYLLGALYGTLAQNDGFCGPVRLSSLLEMTRKAEDAFGRKYHREKERLLNYRMYAFLDSGKTGEAMSLMNRYLGLGESSDPDDWFLKVGNLLKSKNVNAPFKAALILRLLDDIGYDPNRMDVLALISVIQRKIFHPWQLIALNLGRIIADGNQREEAEELLRHGLRICFSGGDTLRPMGLLPLAELHAAGRAKKQDYRQTEEIRAWLAATTALNSSHFSPILSLTDPEVLLDCIMKERGALFRFSYR